MFFELVKQSLLNREPAEKIRLLNDIQTRLANNSLAITPSAEDIEEIITKVLHWKVPSQGTL